ncbi:Lipase [Cladobotryum mycophilum]|uniref:Lipase n=1 Tax=Cladobotryum mycophilum TaxID=491253 RepID=A0ABR0SP57_9HYPO
MLALNLLGLAALAIGTPVPGSIADYTQALKAKRAPFAAVTAAQLTAFQFYAQHSGAAYCNFNTPAGQPVKCGSHVCDNVNATVISSFGGDVTGIGGYVSVDHKRKEVVLSVRGSSNIRNYITDVVFAWARCDLVSECKLHAGFAASWLEIRDAVYDAFDVATTKWPGYKLVATGHSLGAAVSTIAASYLRREGYPVDIYTYGSPRVGNDHYADFVTKQDGAEFRVTHTRDPVPRLAPIVFGYRHTTPEYWLSTGDGSTTDYGVGDIKVCAGNANTDCNGGTFGLDIIAHLHYLGPTSACNGFPFQWKRDESAALAGNGTDQELIDRLNKWSQQDQDFVKNQLQ